ncbi:unnamed protein product [Prunus brigantina]
MSDMELDYSDIPRAFEGESASESSTIGWLDSADSENAGRVGGVVVSTESGSTSSVEVVEVELAKIRALYNIPNSVVMRIPGPLESLSNLDGEVVFFTDVFKHGLRLPLRHSVQKILAQIGYAPG